MYAHINTEIHTLSKAGCHIYFFANLACDLLLTLSSPIPLRLYTLPYWSNPPILIFDIRALWRSSPERQSARMSKIKNGGLDQCGAEPFEQQQFGTAGVEGVNDNKNKQCSNKKLCNSFLQTDGHT